MKITCKLLPFLIALVLQIPLDLFAQNKGVMEIALHYLESQKATLNLTSDDIKEFDVSNMYTSKHNGVTHVYLKQKHQSIEVNQAIFNVNILPNGQVLNHGNRFVSNLKEKINTTEPSIAPEEAVQKVIDHFKLKTKGKIQLQSRSSSNKLVYSPDGLALEPIRVELTYEQMDNGTVRLVWKVHYYQLDAQHAWNARIDAQTGAFLIADDQVIHCNFKGTESVCSNHEHKHDFVKSEFVKTNNESTVVMDNSYNVFAVPVQAPSFGDREIVSNPANIEASPFGWHDTDGEPGAEYTITRGNNAHAYQDIFDLNGSSDDEPDGGEDLVFDFPLDLSENRPYTQIEPGITNLFYWANIMHDVWYNYGFDEEAGNFQSNNYGKGGLEGDFISMEGFDGGGTNNANFFSGNDGFRGRVQMFLWTDEELPEPPVLNLLVTAPEVIEGQLMEMTPAEFGASLMRPGITAPLVLATDGVDATADACEDLTNAEELEGVIALIDRGVCFFADKVRRAQTAGAIGVVVCQNAPGPSIVMSGDDTEDLNIPAVMITMDDCAVLKMNLGEAIVTMESPDLTIASPGPRALDGNLDNGVVAHEYGHGISSRLTGGPANDCLTNTESASEGWSDWFGMVMTTNRDNNSDERRGFGTYSLDQPTTGTGIRNFPYSRDMSINPDTYAAVRGAGSIHRIGSVWCAMIWDLYWDMVDEYSFDDDILNGEGGNNMAMQLVVDGLKLQACDPTFIDARDAILAADVANNGGANECLIWKTFARRGLGVGATAGGFESFELPSNCQITSTDNSSKAELLFDISPNPTDGIFNVKINNVNTEVEAQITSIDGKILLSRKINPSSGNTQFDLTNYQAGVYLLHLETEGFAKVKKIVLQ